jgi:protein subunit release factor B
MALSDELQRLLAECDVETFRSSGAGGQHRNKTESSVRVTHRPSGISRLGTEHRSQHRNRQLALERLAAALAARARRPKPRVATRPTRAAKTRRLESKRRDATVKRLRTQKPSREE